MEERRRLRRSEEAEGRLIATWALSLQYRLGPLNAINSWMVMVTMMIIEQSDDEEDENIDVDDDLENIEDHREVALGNSGMKEERAGSISTEENKVRGGGGDDGEQGGGAGGAGRVRDVHLGGQRVESLLEHLQSNRDFGFLQI